MVLVITSVKKVDYNKFDTPTYDLVIYFSLYLTHCKQMKVCVDVRVYYKNLSEANFPDGNKNNKLHKYNDNHIM